jgi:aminoglycoside phosphotransferase (APT) family kinase protein
VSAESDRIIEVRDEDSFDLSALAKWLDLQGITFSGELTARQFKGGASNLTYLITDSGGQQWVMRTPPHGTKAASAHDMGREARVLTALGPYLSQAPEVVGYCSDPAVLGREFYLMEYIPGIILARSVPENLCPDPSSVRALCESMVDALSALHSVDIQTTGLVELDKGPGYVTRQISGWSSRYRAARTPDVPDAETLMQWLDANQPPDVGHVLIHGDWRFDNLVVNDNAEIIGILDWEMATVGDPCMDLGAAMAYWIQEDDTDEFKILRLQPTDIPGMLTRSEVVQRYSNSMSIEVQESLRKNWLFYEVYGLFRLAVIVQQIWARFSSGATTNPQFGAYGSVTNMLISRAQSKIANL